MSAVDKITTARDGRATAKSPHANQSMVTAEEKSGGGGWTRTHDLRIENTAESCGVLKAYTFM